MNRISIKRKVFFCLFLFLSIVWMSVLYGFSDSTADESKKHSRGISEKVALTIEPDYEIPEKYKEGDFFFYVVRAVRKCAHVAAYALLGALTYFTASALRYFPEKRFMPALFSVPFCILYAGSDEIHQSFVDGRCGRVSDVGFDTIGIMVGTLVAIGIAFVLKRFRERKR